jgi:ornithine cyclodeaminase
MGLQAQIADSADDALADCSLVVSATSAKEVALHARPREDAFVCAIGAFTPAMVEWAPEVCTYIANHGQVFVDTRDADHEAGDLLQAGLDVTKFPTLQALIRGEVAGTCSQNGPVFFKSCGWAGWDLAAARCVVQLLV